MNKIEFLEALESRLTGLPALDVQTSLDYYSEMIDDCMEDGMTEEEAVRSMGSVDEVTERIMSAVPITKLVTAGVKPKRSLAAWEIVLLVLGAPLWLSLLIAVFAVLFSVYAVIWSAVICICAAFISLAVSAVAGIAAGVFQILSRQILQGILLIGAGFVCAGLAILFFLLSGLAAKGAVKLGKAIIRWIRSLFMRKGNDR